MNIFYVRENICRRDDLRAALFGGGFLRRRFAKKGKS